MTIELKLSFLHAVHHHPVLYTYMYPSAVLLQQHSSTDAVCILSVFASALSCLSYLQRQSRFDSGEVLPGTRRQTAPGRAFPDCRQHTGQQQPGACRTPSTSCRHAGPTHALPAHGSAQACCHKRHWWQQPESQSTSIMHTVMDHPSNLAGLKD